MAEIPKELEGLTWKDISRLQSRIQQKAWKKEPLTADEQRLYDYHRRQEEAAIKAGRIFR